MNFNYKSNFFKGRGIIISAFLFIFPCSLFSENIDTALVKINKNNILFENACDIFDVNIKYLKSIVLVERLLNYDWSDDALDEIFARSGLNSSIGFCQVKLKTAYWIEKQIKYSTSKFYPGSKYFGLLKVSKSPLEIIHILQNDSLNILYAAAYIRIIQSLWEKNGFSINKRPDIIGTLYSAGLFQVNGKLREPNNKPTANKFGELVLKYLKLFVNN